MTPQPLQRGQSCGASCHHRGFDLRHSDQASSSFERALAVACLRVRLGRGRQRVTRHVSAYRPRRRPLWFVQDVDDAAAVTR